MKNNNSIHLYQCSLIIQVEVEKRALCQIVLMKNFEYPTFEYDLEKEIMKQRVALQMTKLQTVTGLSLEDFAKEVNLKSSNLSRLESGDHNPTILTQSDLAYRCGYEIEVKVKKKNLLNSIMKLHIFAENFFNSIAT